MQIIPKYRLSQNIDHLQIDFSLFQGLPPPSQTFHENSPTMFCVILLTDNWDEFTASYADAITEKKQMLLKY